MKGYIIMSMTICEVVIPSSEIGGESTLPSIYSMSNVQLLTKSVLDEDDELFVGYGRIPSIFPYRMQDLYNREIKLKSYIGIVFENEYLKALFLPELGGRLWSLYDKVAKKELLYENPVVRPCNLAVRNAWLAGGIEFNCGMIGHHPYTCSKIHAAQTKLDDGTPVLRMYEYERIRGAVYQMDFFLPEKSRQLFGRMRIVNPTEKTVPMYWWTNIALRENPEARDVFDATETYNNKGGMVCKNAVPYDEGIDITYPTNNPVAIDFFWKIPDKARKYTAYIDREGYGFFQTSTSRLKGRKLFVWGQGEGGRRWQEFLTEDGHDGRYIEIQAGIARTQYECLPMPPKTAWEWLEAYGAVSADPEKIHGDWEVCRRELFERLAERLPEEKLENMLRDTHTMATSPAQKQICYGSAWGTLENLRRAKRGEAPVCPHLDFGAPTQEQSPWIALMDEGKIAESKNGEAPVSWMLQEEWTEMLEKSEDCHGKYLHLAAIYIAERKIRDAEEAIDAALAIEKSPIALFLKAQIHRLRDEADAAADVALRAHLLMPDDISLARQSLALALSAKKHKEIIDAYENAPEAVKADGRIAMLYSFALLRSGKLAEAEAVLLRDGGLSVTDIREGENSITGLYIEIAKAKAEALGEQFDEEALDIPRRFDFRMKVAKKK